MKQVTEKEQVTRPNAWGRDGTYDVQKFIVEEADVGTSRENYLGFRHRSYRFYSADVGHTIEVLSSPGWTCWSFTPNSLTPNRGG